MIDMYHIPAAACELSIGSMTAGWTDFADRTCILADSLASPSISQPAFWLAAIIISLSVLAAAIYIINAPSQRARYVVLVLLLGFSLSTTISMLFLTQADVKISTPVFTMGVTGAAALWLGATIVFLRLLPPESLFESPVYNEFGTLLTKMELDLGWAPYESWKAVQQVARTLFAGLVEEQVVRNLLHVTCLHDTRSRLTGVAVTTLFVYFPDHVVKVQRVVGKHADAEARLRVKSYSSFGGPAPRQGCFLAAARNGQLEIGDNFTDLDQTGSRKYGYEHLRDQSVDCLLITRYEDAPAEDEDYLLIEMPRFSSAPRGAVRLGVSSAGRPLSAHELWTMRHSSAVRAGYLPLVFREPPCRSAPGIASVREHLLPWLTAIDSRLAAGAPKPLNPDIVALLRTLQGPGPVDEPIAPLAGLVAPRLPDHEHEYVLENATDVTLMLVRFQS